MVNLINMVYIQTAQGGVVNLINMVYIQTAEGGVVNLINMVYRLQRVVWLT